ncbi:MAG: ATP-binding protein [Methanomassiliicoccaceae archaeon]|nr:ATP-binding protein [Methanomassiliicoccaceae archaeon]
MPESADAPIDGNVGLTGRYVSRPLYASYAAMLILSIIVLAAGAYTGSLLEVFVAVPVIVILADALFIDRETVHIPPLMVFLSVGLMALIVAGRSLGDVGPLRVAVDCLLGAVMGLGGLVAVYSFAAVTPASGRGRPAVVALASMSAAISLFTAMLALQHYLGLALGMPARTLGETMDQLLLVASGAASVVLLFYIGRGSAPVRRAAERYLAANAATLGIEEYEAMEIEGAIKSGEGERVEYKSTLRTNLATGERDARMERAVLKTLVAFLNGRGGTLLIGVADDGTVVGIDEHSFDSRDRLNLHLTNLIASQIGNEFLPFISFRLSDYEGKGVMRVVCRRSGGPVFLKDGKQEAFFVRSGPSSVELQGMDILSYVDNRFKKRGKRKSFGG